MKTKNVNLGQIDGTMKGFINYFKSFDKGQKINNLFALNFALMSTNSLLMPVRESLTLEGGKQLQTKLMMLTVIVSMGGQAIFAYYSGKYGGLQTLRKCFYISSVTCVATYCCLIFAPSIRMIFSSSFYLWFTFYNMTSMSTFWAIAGDIIEEEETIKQTNQDEQKEQKTHSQKIEIFSHLAAGGTLGHMTGSSLSTVLIKEVGSKLCLLVLSMGFLLSVTLCGRIEQYKLRCLSTKVDSKKEGKIDAIKEIDVTSEDDIKDKKNPGFVNLIYVECGDQLRNVRMIWENPILCYSFFYSILLSTSLGLTVIERTIAAKASGLGADEYAKVLAGNQTLHGAIQFLLQFFGAGAIIAFCGPIAALSAAGMARFLSFLAFFSIQAQIFPNLTVWYSSHAVIPVTFVIITDLICRLTTQTISKPVRESLWVFIPKSNKYRSKIIVDVLAHRIGTSLAAFLANVQILWVLNNYIVSLEVTQTVYKIFNGNSDLKFTGFIGQDHIVWGILATILLCIFGVLLGNAFNNSTKKAKAE